MKILAMTPWGSMIGGANRSFLMVIKNLKNKYNSSITVVVPEEGELTNELNKEDIPFVIVKSFNSNVKIKGNVKDVARIIKVAYYDIKNKLIAEKTKGEFENFDIVYLNSASLIYGYYLSKVCDIPCVWHFRGFITGDNIFSINQRRKYNDKNGKIIVISNDMKKSLPETLGIEDKKIVMISNGLEKSELPPVTHNKTHFNCLMCGRITRWKCQHDAINAVAQVIKKGYSITLHIAGSASSNDDKEYYSELLDLVSKLEIKDNVIFHGQVKNVDSLRNEMDIEFNCSSREPFGRTTIEGMQRGLVVIGSNTGGTLDIITDGINGFLYQQGNTNDLAEKIIHVLDNPDVMIKVSEEAYSFTKNHFTTDENVEKIYGVLRASVK